MIGQEATVRIKDSARRNIREDVTANDDPPCATHYHPQIAVDAKGNLHVIWFDNRYLVGNIFYAESGPADAMNPLRFGPNTFVNDASFPFVTRFADPAWPGDYLGLVAVSSGLYAVWSDGRDDTGRAHIRLARGTLP